VALVLGGCAGGVRCPHVSSLCTGYIGSPAHFLSAVPVVVRWRGAQLVTAIEIWPAFLALGSVVVLQSDVICNPTLGPVLPSEKFAKLAQLLTRSAVATQDVGISRIRRQLPRDRC